MRYWSESFKGGTKANIPSSAVQAAKSSSSALKLSSKFVGFASTAGSYLGYYGVAENLYKEDYYGAPFQNKKFFGGIYGDGFDRYRTAALSLSVGDLSASFNLFTGSRTSYKGDSDKVGNRVIGNYGERMPRSRTNPFVWRHAEGSDYQFLIVKK